MSEILEYGERLNLDSTSAPLCYFCVKSMDIIHQKSLTEVRKALIDIEFVDEVIQGISQVELRELRNLDDFSHFYKDNRTVEQAFSILYSHYGHTLPAVDSWVPGVYGFLETRGWQSSAIRKELKLLQSSNVRNIHRIVYGLTPLDIENYKAIKDWRLKHLNRKSIELCFKILYAKYGYCLPVAKEWPFGLSDYCKHKGWNNKRVYSAFFPDKYIQQPLLLAFLSHSELAPNVDSVFYYAYLDTIVKGFEKSKVRVFLGKYRGSPIDTELNKSDPLVLVVREYIEHYKARLSSFRTGQAFLMQEFASIFGHIFRERGPLELRLYDPSTPSNWVQPAIKRYAENELILRPLITSRVTGENFRSTHAVIDTFKGVNQGLIKKKLSHSHSSTTSSYTSRVETASVLKIKQLGFQSYIIEQSRLPSENNHRILDSHINSPGMQDLKIVKRVVFSDINIVAEWIAYRIKISKEKGRLILSNPARWANYWEVKLAEYEALLSLVGSREFSQAKEIAKGLSLPHLD